MPTTVAKQEVARFPGEEFVRCLKCLHPICVLLAAIHGTPRPPDLERWCVGGCDPWKDSPEGIELYRELKEKYEASNR